jgi:predicted nuclease of predicted toxin-antitoxin system
MKIKLDENLPSSLAIPLERLGHGVHTVQEENLTGRPDREVWEAVQLESRFLVIQDLDFSDLRHFSLGSHHGILLLRLRSADRKSLLARVEEIFQTEYVGDWAGCFVVASERKIRLLKPPNKQNS